MQKDLHALLKKAKTKTKTFAKRSLDSHLRLAVTGLSESGKTAFITSLVNQLLEGNTSENLPFFDVVQSGRLIGIKLIPQDDLSIATFPYSDNIAAFAQNPPRWPNATSRINTVRLVLKYAPKGGLKARLADTMSLTLDIIDYPGEWLMDLGLLQHTYQSWSDAKWQALTSDARKPYAKDFIEAVNQTDWQAPQPESHINKLAELYQQLLLKLKKEAKLSLLQPGRLLMPGDLDGAPMIAFFPLPKDVLAENSDAIDMLVQRFKAYQSNVVTPFYKRHFQSFDRQVVLVDVLSALNQGDGAVKELKQSLNQTLAHFNYGKQNILTRLFAPHIDKVLFVANKVDRVTPEQHKDCVLLLNSLLKDAQRQMQFDHTDIETLAMAAVNTTDVKTVNEQGQTLQCLVGAHPDTGETTAFLPSLVPSFYDDGQGLAMEYAFSEFAPKPLQNGQLQHLRFDHALEYLIGDKLL